MLEDEHPQHDGGGRAQSAPALTLRVALRQGLRHAIDEDIVVEQGVDLPKRGVPQFVAIGEEDFDEAALSVRSPHHGASGEADRVSRVARGTNARRSLTIADRPTDRQGIWCIRTSSDITTPDEHRGNRLCSAPGSNYIKEWWAVTGLNRRHQDFQTDQRRRASMRRCCTSEI